MRSHTITSGYQRGVNNYPSILNKDGRYVDKMS